MYKENFIERNPSAEHIAFADVIAEKYDAHYDMGGHFASKSYMNFEESTLQTLIDNLPNRNFAADLGCGTGRLSFLLSSYFKNVKAFDISQSMVNCAISKLSQNNVRNIEFAQSDLNNGIPLNDNSVDFIYSAFGLGSFVANINYFCEEMLRILKNNGKAIISFYNKQALLYELNIPWNPSLSAIVDVAKTSIKINVEDILFSIYAVAYSLKEVQDILSKYFTIRFITTFPTLASFLPDELLKNKKLNALCNSLDLLLANNKLDLGAYILAVVEK